MHALTRVAFSHLLGLAAQAVALAQCDPVLQPGYGVAGVNGYVEAATAWDPDGPGPLGEHLVVGGSFTLAGGVRANGIAQFNPVTGQWSAIGNLSGRIKALAVLTNGDLVAGGAGVSIGLVGVNSVARWDGTSWSPLGSGCTSPPISAPEVRALAVRPNGDLIAGGQFTLAGGVQAISIARWDGAAWHSMGNLLLPIFLPAVESLATLPNGDVIAGGLFDSAGGVPVTHIARWDGSAWHGLGSGVAPATPGGLTYVRRLAVRANGNVVVAGLFGVAGGQPANHIAQWDGVAWSPLGAGLGQVALALRELPNGELLAGGHQILGTQSVARWNGSVWSGMGNLPSFGANALAVLTNGTIFAGGDFRPQGAFGGRGVARWNGSEWEGVSTGGDGAITKLLDLGDGRLLALGDLRAVAGVPVLRAAFFDSQTWHPADGLVAGTVEAAAALPDGTAFAAVRADSSGSSTAFTVQRWNGTMWNTIATAGSVQALATAPNGDLYMAGGFGSIGTGGGTVAASGLAVWNGNSWSQAQQAPGSWIDSLLITRSGQLVASGLVPGYVARWNGASWVPMGGGIQQPATGLVERANGDIIAIGNWSVVNGSPCNDIARWNGSAWQGLGTGLGTNVYTNQDQVTSVAALPNGDVLAGGRFQVAGGVPVQNIARWDGTAWFSVGAGADAKVATVVATPNGTIAMGGDFLTFAGQVSAFFARLDPVCPALAVGYGTSCFGAATSLHIENLAFVGGVMRSRVEGVPAGSLVLAVVGFSPTQMPLPSLLAQGTLGCSLLASPDYLYLQAASGTTARTALAIPRVAALVGAVLYHQTLPVALPAPGGFAVTASNGQALVVGGLW